MEVVVVLQSILRGAQYERLFASAEVVGPGADGSMFMRCPAVTAFGAISVGARHASWQSRQPSSPLVVLSRPWSEIQ